MCRNLGIVDRAVRLVLGLVAIGLGLFALGGLSGAWIGIIVGAVGVILVGTAAMSFCPLYLPLKLSTCATKPGQSGRSL